MALLDMTDEDTSDPTSVLQQPMLGMPNPASTQPGGMDRILNAIKYVESGGNPNAVSPAGAVGPYQIMPQTAANPGMGVQPLDQSQLTQEAPSRAFAGDYLRALYSKLGNWPAAFAAFNGGMKRGQAFNSGSPLPAETAAYPGKIMDAMSLGHPAQAGLDNISDTYDAAQDGPGVDNSAPSTDAQPKPTYPGGVPPETMPLGSAIGPGVTTSAPTEGAPMQPSAVSPIPTQQPSGAAPDLSAMLREYLNPRGGGGLFGGNGMNLSEMAQAVGAGLPGSAFRGVSEKLLEMNEQRRNAQLLQQQKLFPQMLAYNALVKQGVPPTQAMLRSFAPQAVGQWEPKDIQSGSGMPRTIWWNSALGKGYDPSSNKTMDMNEIMNGGAGAGAGNAPAGSAGFGAGDKFTDADGKPLMGDDLKAALENDKGGWAPMAKTIEGIANYDVAPKDIRMNIRSNMSALAWDMAKRINPNLSQSNYEQVYNTSQKYNVNSGPKSPAGMIVMGNTALKHLGEVSDAGEDLNNVQGWSLLNKPINELRNMKQQYSGTADNINAFTTKRQKYVSEVSSFYNATGGSVGEREEAALKDLNEASSPSELRHAIQANVDLIQGKVQSLQTGWQQGTLGLKGDFPIISPESQGVIDKIGVRDLNRTMAHDELQKLVPNRPVDASVLKADAAAKAANAPPAAPGTVPPAAGAGTASAATAVPNEQWIKGPRGEAQVARNGKWVDWQPGM